MMKNIGYRIYQNMLMNSRLGDYRCLLESLVEQNYTFLTVANLAIRDTTKAPPEATCIIRMDVDSDVSTAESMFEIARRSGVRATYYFRLSTLDQDLMRRISAHGSEVGFHYEELATIAKRLGLRNKAQVDEHLPEIREEFAKNLAIFAKHAGHWPLTIASHGDWMNRRLRIPNQYAIDPGLRSRFDIVAEAYDECLDAPVKARFSDIDAPAWWKPCAPDRAISDRVSCLYFLVHPRQWRANVLQNLRLDTERVMEEAIYRFRA